MRSDLDPLFCGASTSFNPMHRHSRVTAVVQPGATFATRRSGVRVPSTPAFSTYVRLTFSWAAFNCSNSDAKVWTNKAVSSIVNYVLTIEKQNEQQDQVLGV